VVLITLLVGNHAVLCANGVEEASLAITVAAVDSVELVDAHGRLDGYRDGHQVRMIPRCTRNVEFGEPSIGDTLNGTEGAEEDTLTASLTMFTLMSPDPGTYRLLVHGPAGGFVSISTQGSGVNGEGCGVAVSDSVGGGAHEWRVIVKDNCANSVIKAKTQKTAGRGKGSTQAK